MKIDAKDVNDYFDKVAEDRKDIMMKLRKIINNNLPEGFEECLNYGMPGWVIPHNIYPEGYHCTPDLPLPFMNIASQKNFIGLHHMGIYSDPNLLKWFLEEYAKQCKYKIDMGKSCIRLKRMNDIPYELIAKLCQKMTPHQWIKLYEKNFKK